jgi:hypothetical protein
MTRYFRRLPASLTTEDAMDAAEASGAVAAPRLHDCESCAVVGSVEVCKTGDAEAESRSARR